MTSINTLRHTATHVSSTKCGIWFQWLIWPGLGPMNKLFKDIDTRPKFILKTESCWKGHTRIGLPLGLFDKAAPLEHQNIDRVASCNTKTFVWVPSKELTAVSQLFDDWLTSISCKKRTSWWGWWDLEDWFQRGQKWVGPQFQVPLDSRFCFGKVASNMSRTSEIRLRRGQLYWQ